MISSIKARHNQLQLGHVWVALILAFFVIQPLQAASWVTNGPLNVARYSHTATLLLNGQVLIAGGVSDNSRSTNNAELYDPATGNCRVTGPMHAARREHTAVLLLSGQVLAAGG